MVNIFLYAEHSFLTSYKSEVVPQKYDFIAYDGNNYLVLDVCHVVNKDVEYGNELANVDIEIKEI